jgi:hypothetical protein
MAAKVKSIAILGDVKQVINQSGGAAGMTFATSILGYNVSRLNVRVEIDLRGGAAASLPDKIPAEVRFRDPGLRQPPAPGSLPDFPQWSERSSSNGRQRSRSWGGCRNISSASPAAIRKAWGHD